MKLVAHFCCLEFAWSRHLVMLNFIWFSLVQQGGLYTAVAGSVSELNTAIVRTVCLSRYQVTELNLDT